MSIIAAEKLSLTLSKRPVVQDVDCQMEGGLIGMIGPNGAGKSSLLKLLAGIWMPSRGRVLLKNQPLSEWSLDGRAKIMAYLPQQPRCEWPMTVQQILALSLGHRQLDTHYITRLHENLGLTQLLHRRFDELSGGQQQRAMLARAFIGQPELAILDEPVAAQDPSWQLRTMQWLQREATSRCILIALHDMALATRFCTHLAVMDQGFIKLFDVKDRVIRSGLMNDVFGVSVQTIEEDGQCCNVPWHLKDASLPAA